MVPDRRQATNQPSPVPGFQEQRPAGGSRPAARANTIFAVALSPACTLWLASLCERERE
jgi:hypothetical protein